VGFEAFDHWAWPYAFILVAGMLPTIVWRWAGVIAAGRLDETGEVFTWVRCVATALVAGVITRLILFPEGALATAPMALRLAAVAAGFAVFKLAGERILAGIIAAELVLIGGWLAI
jgi:hypothetical protein